MLHGTASAAEHLLRHGTRLPATFELLHCPFLCPLPFLPETIKCKSPSHESFGALPSSVAVQIGGEGWTVNPLAFSFFANTAPSLCLAYGPGLLQASGR